MTAAILRASYADWKLVKTRACVQVVFEIPVEQSDAAYQLLGGMPVAAREVWCAIARLNELPQRVVDKPPAETSPRPTDVTRSAGADKPAKSPAQIAGYLCTLPSFQKFLRDKFSHEWGSNWPATENNIDTAKQCIYDICKVTSRTQLTNDNTEWHALQLGFQLWQNHPELEST